MVEKDLSVAIFGDCATHISCKEYRHTRAVGLSNWVSIVSPSIDEFTRLTEESLKELPMANYEKRICLLNANKQFINYLLGEKADYLIIDCNDCRKGVIYDNSGEHNALACITSNPHMAGFSQVLETIFGDKEKYRYHEHTYLDRFKDVMGKVNKLALFTHGDEPNTSRILSFLSTIELETGHKVQVTLVDEHENQGKKIFGLPVLSSLPETVAEYDYVLHVCRHIFKLEIEEPDAYYVDGWGNLMLGEDDLKKLVDYRKMLEMFVMSYKERLIGEIQDKCVQSA